MKAEKNHISAAKLTVTAVFFAMNILLSSFGIPVPGGNLYLCDAVICLAAILLEPPFAFAVGGLGSFIGDMIFYPATMFISLAVHGLQALVISLISRHMLKSHPVMASGIGAAAGALIMVTGYPLGKILLFDSAAFAWISVPYDAVQALTGAALGMVLCWRCGIYRLFHSMTANRG